MLYSNVCACKITTILHSKKYKPTKNVFILKIIFCFNQTVQQMQAAWFRQLQNVRVRKISAKPTTLCITPSPWCPLIPPYISPISPNYNNNYNNNILIHAHARVDNNEIKYSWEEYRTDFTSYWLPAHSPHAFTTRIHHAHSPHAFTTRYSPRGILVLDTNCTVAPWRGNTS